MAVNPGREQIGRFARGPFLPETPDISLRRRPSAISYDMALPPLLATCGALFALGFPLSPTEVAERSRCYNKPANEEELHGLAPERSRQAAEDSAAARKWRSSRPGDI